MTDEALVANKLVMSYKHYNWLVRKNIIGEKTQTYTSICCLVNVYGLILNMTFRKHNKTDNGRYHSLKYCLFLLNKAANYNFIFYG